MLAFATSAFRRRVSAGPFEAADLRRRRGLGSRAVALIGRLAGRPFRVVREAAFDTGVVDLQRVAVFVPRDEDLPRDEEGIARRRR